MITRTKVEKVIGKGFAEVLDEAIFEAGNGFIYTRREMVEELGCANFIAAAKLAKVIKRLKIESPAQLVKVNPIDLARVKGIGASCIFVAMSILEANGYDSVKWWGIASNTKFSSFKSAAMRRASKRKQEV